MTKPAPAPDDITAFYWRGAAEGRLEVTRCVPHGHLSHPPEPACPFCGSLELEPVAVSGRGAVYSFAVVRQAFDPAFVSELPYLVALVELDEQAGLRVLTNLVDVDVDADAVEIGMRVEVTFEDRGDHVVPQFRPADTTVSTR